jgi:hypothetical protein
LKPSVEIAFTKTELASTIGNKPLPVWLNRRVPTVSTTVTT